MTTALNWLIILLLSVLTVECLLISPLFGLLKSFSAVIGKVLAVIPNKKISDRWKEKILPRYALRLFKLSLFTAASILFIFLPFIIAAGVSQLYGKTFHTLLYSLWGILGSTGAAFAYAYLRKKTTDPSKDDQKNPDGEQGDYSFDAQLLHEFALNSDMIPEMSFKMDRMLHRADPQKHMRERHVFISGLARAGTTALLRLFYETGRYTSLSYRDMPFPLAPYFWSFLSGISQKKGELRERAHKDGMLVDFDSPEALEEVFWRVFSGRDYIRADRLLPMEVDEETIFLFRKYIAGILKTRKKDRYLSKNNNNILRIPSLNLAFPQAVVLIPYRDPVEQAASLFRQHLHFTEVHKKEKFAKKYMNWLVHHEFGGDHRFFDVNGGELYGAPDEAAYWLDQWIRVYAYLLNRVDQGDMKAYFVEYEALCDDSERVWNALARHADLPLELPVGFSLKKAKKHGEINAEPAVLEKAYALYEKLRALFEKNMRA